MDPALVRAVIAALATALVAAWAHWRLVDRDRHARRRRILTGTKRLRDRVIEADEGSVVVLSGRLESPETSAAGATVATTLVPGGRDGLIDPVTTQLPRLDLVVGNTRVAIDHAVEVLVGSLELRGDEATRAATCAIQAADVEEPVFEVDAVRTVTPGARVLARGRLERVGGEEAPGTYRTAAAGWRLAPDPDGDSVLLAARSSRGSGELVRRAALAAGVGAAVLAMASAPLIVFAVTPSPTGPLELAAEHRRDAYAAWTAGDPAQAARQFIQARRLGDDGLPTITEIEALLITSHATESAALARRLAKERPWVAKGDPWLECYADAITPSLEAGSRLHHAAYAQGAPAACLLLHADRGSQEERTGALAHATRTAMSDWSPGRLESKQLLTWLALEHDAAARADAPDAWSDVLDQPVALERIMLGRAEATNDHETQASWHCALATFEAVLGNHRQAARHMSLALQLLEIGSLAATDLFELHGAKTPFAYLTVTAGTKTRGGVDPSELRTRHARFLEHAATLATRAGYLVEAGELFDLAGHAPGARARAELDFMTQPWTAARLAAVSSRAASPEQSLLWRAVETGGDAVERRLHDTPTDGHPVVPLLARATPRKRDELAQWVGKSYPAPCSTCGVRALVDHLSKRLDSAAATGAIELAQDLERPLQVYGSVLARRDYAVPLLVLDRIGRGERW